MRTILFCNILLLISNSSIAQRKAAEAYWVVETNKKTARYSIVRLYDVDHQLLFEKKIDGVVIDINRNRHKRRLNRIVDHYYLESTTKFPEKLFQFRKGLSRLSVTRFARHSS